MDLEPRTTIARCTARSPLPTQLLNWKLGSRLYLHSASSYSNRHEPSKPVFFSLPGWSGLAFNSFSGSVGRVVFSLRTMVHFPEVYGGAYIFCIRSKVCFLFYPCPTVYRAQRVGVGPTGLWATSDLPELPGKEQYKLSHDSGVNLEAHLEGSPS